MHKSHQKRFKTKQKWSHPALISCMPSSCCSSKLVGFSFTTVSRPLYPLLIPGLNRQDLQLVLGTNQSRAVMHRCSLLKQQKHLPLTVHSSWDFCPTTLATDTCWKGQRPGGKENYHLRSTSSLLRKKGWLLKSTSKQTKEKQNRQDSSCATRTSSYRDSVCPSRDLQHHTHQTLACSRSKPKVPLGHTLFPSCGEVLCQYHTVPIMLIPGMN